MMKRKATGQELLRPPSRARGRPGARSAPPAPAAKTRRRKPQARSAATRERILEAALECLVERGYARTATADVAESAGVSRGAQLHHFPTRAGLLAATVGHLAERRLAEFRGAVASPPPGGDEVGAAIDFVWSVFSDSTAYATLELIVAARTDEDLLASLRPVVDRFADALRLADRELAPSRQDRERFNAFRNLVLASLQGLAVMQIVRRDPAFTRGVLDLLKALHRDLFPPRRRSSMRA